MEKRIAKTNNTHLEMNLEDALDSFQRMLRTRPLPSVVAFNQLLGKLVKTKHYSVVISLYKQMGMQGIVPDHYTLSIVMNCFCHLSQMQCSLSVFGNFIKFDYKPDTVTMTTPMKGFFQ